MRRQGRSEQRLRGPHRQVPQGHARMDRPDHARGLLHRGAQQQPRHEEHRERGLYLLGCRRAVPNARRGRSGGRRLQLQVLELRSAAHVWQGDDGESHRVRGAGGRRRQSGACGAFGPCRSALARREQKDLAAQEVPRVGRLLAQGLLGRPHEAAVRVVHSDVHGLLGELRVPEHHPLHGADHGLCRGAPRLREGLDGRDVHHDAGQHRRRPQGPRRGLGEDQVHALLREHSVVRHPQPQEEDLLHPVLRQGDQRQRVQDSLDPRREGVHQ
mmetsp:Transcript_136856/g.425132  ORF Transcript_136856/g.425132 Transcript_136856/m.425132 type:complete len:271 (+) Transcript_136856:736-1548(+)